MDGGYRRHPPQSHYNSYEDDEDFDNEGDYKVKDEYDADETMGYDDVLEQNNLSDGVLNKNTDRMKQGEKDNTRGDYGDLSWDYGSDEMIYN